jgi:hypothetical protein
VAHRRPSRHSYGFTTAEQVGLVHLGTAVPAAGVLLARERADTRHVAVSLLLVAALVTLAAFLADLHTRTLSAVRASPSASVPLSS